MEHIREFCCGEQMDVLNNRDIENHLKVEKFNSDYDEPETKEYINLETNIISQESSTTGNLSLEFEECQSTEEYIKLEPVEEYPEIEEKNIKEYVDLDKNREDTEFEIPHEGKNSLKLENCGGTVEECLKSDSDFEPAESTSMSPSKFEENRVVQKTSEKALRKDRKIHRCSACDLTFQYRYLLKKHELTHSEILYECKICLRKFTRPKYLQGHLKIHSDSGKPYQCEVCGKNFLLQYYLKRHKMTHKTAKDHKCKICEKMYKDLSSLRKHLIKHTGQKPFQCSICNKQFFFRSNMMIHLRIHTGEKPFECSFCSKKFRLSCHLLKHTLTHTKGPYQCEYCDKKYKFQKRLKAHYETVHSALMAHERETSNPESIPSTQNDCTDIRVEGARPAKQCDCKVSDIRLNDPSKQHMRDFKYCVGEKFLYSHSLEDHKHLNLGVNNEISGKASLSKSKSRENSLAKNDEEGQHECGVCGKVFLYLPNLADHVKEHPEYKQYQCDICSMQYVNIQGLISHKQSFVESCNCEICGKTFCYKTQVGRHMKIHANDLPHDCVVCGKTMQKTSDLVRHALIHRQEKVHKCDVCDEAYSTRKDLTQHVKIHKSEIYKCSVCDEKFSKGYDLYKHAVAHRSEKP